MIYLSDLMKENKNDYVISAYLLNIFVCGRNSAPSLKTMEELK